MRIVRGMAPHGTRSIDIDKAESKSHRMIYTAILVIRFLLLSMLFFGSVFMDYGYAESIDPFFFLLLLLTFVLQLYLM